MPFQKEHITVEDRMRLVATFVAEPPRYGKVTECARTYGLSRQRVYGLVERGRAGLAASVQPRPPGRPPAEQALHVDKNRIDRGIVTLTVAGHASIQGVQGCLAELLDVDRSAGYVSGVLDRAGAGARAWQGQLCPPGPVRADLDELFTGRTPQLAIVEPVSLLLLALERTGSRDSTAWGVTLLEQTARGVVFTEVASDAAAGIAGGVAAAELAVPHLLDLFHVLRDLGRVGSLLEKTAYAAIGQEERARLVAAEAQAPRRRRGRPRTGAGDLAAAAAARGVAIQRADDFGWLVAVVRATLAPLDAATGRLHAAAHSRQELEAVVALLREHPEARVRQAAGRLERAIDGLVVFQERLAQEVAPWVAQWGEETVALLAWGWRHRQGLGLTTPEAVAAAFPAAQHAAVAAIWAALDHLHRGSSLVECVNSLLRPHLLVHRGADQGLLDLLLCALNHRVFTRGKRRGQSPLELAGLPAADDWLVVIGFAPKTPPGRRRASTRRPCPSRKCQPKGSLI